LESAEGSVICWSFESADTACDSVGVATGVLAAELAAAAAAAAAAFLLELEVSKLKNSFFLEMSVGDLIWSCGEVAPPLGELTKAKAAE